MKNIVFILLAGLFVMPVFAQQESAKGILDKTSSVFRKAGGIDAGFTIKIKMKAQPDGTVTGNIRLKGEKFMLKTADAVTWFDGTTQWSYQVRNEEVSVSNPTEEELQGINPYALLSIYQKGFNSAMGSTKLFSGKAVYEVVLTATDKRNEISRLKLYIARDTYQLLYIYVGLRNGDRNEITITSYKDGLKMDDSLFVFDKKQYPRAEVIDLR